jgi:hypothetical protein
MVRLYECWENAQTIWSALVVLGEGELNILWTKLS